MSSVLDGCWQRPELRSSSAPATTRALCSLVAPKAPCSLRVVGISSSVHIPRWRLFEINVRCVVVAPRAPCWLRMGEILSSARTPRLLYNHPSFVLVATWWHLQLRSSSALATTRALCSLRHSGTQSTVHVALWRLHHPLVNCPYASSQTTLSLRAGILIGHS